MKPAIIVVDMLKGGIESSPALQSESERIIPNIQRLLVQARDLEIPVIYACDSFLHQDFIFRGKMRPHSVRGTEGAEIVNALKPESKDMILEKRRFSAFFRTDLDITLRTLKRDTIVVCGMNTHVCVMFTAWDGLANDFHVVLLEDCCAAPKKEIHDTAIALYEKSPIFPLFRIITLDKFLEEVETL